MWRVTFGMGSVVVKDVRYTSLRGDVPLVTYRASRQDPNAPANTFLIRTSANVKALMPFLHAQVREVAPALPPPAIVTVEDQVAAALLDERILAALSSAFGLLAAILGAIGIHSTIASVVGRRRREIGIRIALGAMPGQVARMIVADMSAIVGAGLAIGVPAAIAAGLAARSFLARALFEVSPRDPCVLLGSVASILLLAGLAAYGPARRASRIDPVAAVRQEE
jgi:predicted lysophospholipase L1 biosynthesis ABC-type transport system permease subunit